MQDMGFDRDSKNIITQLQLADNGSLNIVDIYAWHSVPQILSHLTSMKLPDPVVFADINDPVLASWDGPSNN
jgi:hypothetical protein